MLWVSATPSVMAADVIFSQVQTLSANIFCGSEQVLASRSEQLSRRSKQAIELESFAIFCSSSFAGSEKDKQCCLPEHRASGTKPLIRILMEARSENARRSHIHACVQETARTHTHTHTHPHTRARTFLKWPHRTTLKHVHGMGESRMIEGVCRCGDLGDGEGCGLQS